MNMTKAPRPALFLGRNGTLNAGVPRIALILAGGRGTRLRPITYRMPKPLVRVNGKAAIAHIIDEIMRNGISEIYVSVGYRAGSIISYLNRYKTGAAIRYVREDSSRPLGTGGALRRALATIRRRYRGDIFVTNGDDLFSLDIPGMYAFHKAKRAELTLLVKRASNANELRSSGVVALRGARIVGFVEKPEPKEAPSRLISIGKLIMSTGIYTRLPRARSFSFEKEFLQKGINGTRMYAYASEGPWYPIDNIERLERARSLWKGR